jgi:glycosyltransferase involved in cell wall biosynthesis
MIISYSKPVDTNRGRNNFLRRLFHTLREKHGVQTRLGNGGDLHLAFPMEPLPRGVKNVVRIDGVYYDRRGLGWNAAIRKQMVQADGIIFQSEWSRIMARRILKAQERDSAVVYNGAEPQEFAGVVPDKKGFDKVFLACAHWRPNKRLEAMVEAFIQVAARSEQKIGFFVVGGDHKGPRHESVVYFGDLPHDKVRQVYASCDYYVHISHLESCSNAVVDALVCGLPVLCNNIGGTPEIVGSCGISLGIDPPFDFQIISNMDVVGSSKVDVSLVARGMEQMLSNQWSVCRPDLYLENIASKYMAYFQKVLS